MSVFACAHIYVCGLWGIRRGGEVGVCACGGGRGGVYVRTDFLDPVYRLQAVSV